MTSGNVDNAAFGLLVAAAVAMFAPISRALPGFFNTLVAIFLPALEDIFPRILKKLPRPSAYIVLSLTIIDFFLLQTMHFPTNSLVSLPVFLLTVISPVISFVPDLCLPPTQ